MLIKKRNVVRVYFYFVNRVPNGYLTSVISSVRIHTFSPEEERITPLYLLYSPDIMGGMIDRVESSGQQTRTPGAVKNDLLIGCPVQDKRRMF